MTDTALVLRARGGDELALRRLLDRYRPELVGIVNDYFLPGGDWDDLMQEAQFGFHKAVRDYRPAVGAPFRYFAKLCARRQAIVAVKAANRGKHRPLNEAVSFSAPMRGVTDDEDAVLGNVLPGDGPEPAEKLIQRDRLVAVIDTVWGLSELERTAVLGIADGYSYEEVCQQSGETFKRIDNAAQRGKRKLAAALEAAA